MCHVVKTHETCCIQAAKSWKLLLHLVFALITFLHGIRFKTEESHRFKLNNWVFQRLAIALTSTQTTESFACCPRRFFSVSHLKKSFEALLFDWETGVDIFGSLCPTLPQLQVESNSWDWCLLANTSSTSGTKGTRTKIKRWNYFSHIKLLNFGRLIFTVTFSQH